eukprot:CAMPEP_0198244346 /NCGR_PEP_ID=MMETSP1446-20131203/34367_1 /TAXON_ID=1461542 ORGANISM="Unidentified sp, Strain CCMP2111" /NCGR_SAMPLE_ID=MMETSP1446 /ASSEMBLY_ACC=CAM_ASM_001112 /LENGTH=197 /DNA_ID=CAMNT_0043928361 /DNA_START=30 /DNA_END=619 /DNA_ORIENTATION=+
MAPGDIAFKCNFATVEERGSETVVVRRRCDRHFEEEGPVLCAYLDSKLHSLPSFPSHRVRVKYATEHRCGVTISGPSLCDRITSTDPLRDGLPLLVASPVLKGGNGIGDVSTAVGPATEDAEATLTAAVVNEASETIRSLLEAHPINARRIEEGKPPANCVILRGCGEMMNVAGFSQRYHGTQAFMVAPTKVIAGIG